VFVCKESVKNLNKKLDSDQKHKEENFWAINQKNVPVKRKWNEKTRE